MTGYSPLFIFAGYLCTPNCSIPTMNQGTQKPLTHFFLIGISYEKADTATRSLFAVGDKAYLSMIEKARGRNISEMFVLSTCNRTEVYGFADSADELVALLCKATKGDEQILRKLAYVYQGRDAVKHLYCVAAGLNSQILGDYEIISQVKTAARFARDNGALGTFTERLLNSVLQVSKQIKNETQLSSGTVSVSFAAVQYLKDIPDVSKKNILLYGLGKIGKNTCKNLMKYFKADHITLINRTDQKVETFAAEHYLSYAPFSQLKEKLNTADIILVATNASKPTIKKSYFTAKSKKIILDLSIPHNVEATVKSLPGVKVIGVDELSQVQDKTLSRRKKEVPKALAIIEEQMEDFLYWYRMRKHAVVLQAVKKKLEQIHFNEIKGVKKAALPQDDNVSVVSTRIIQKMVNVFAGKLRQANGNSDNYLQVISEIFEVPISE